LNAGLNLFAYCGNNPVICQDTTGEFGTLAIFGSIAFWKIGIAFVGAILGFLFVDTIAKNPPAAPTFSLPVIKSEQSTDSEIKDVVPTIPSAPDGPVIFPLDPMDFNPAGLVMTPRPGTKNGAIISWMDPLTNTEVFRWDENPNYSNGPHYHIYGSGHYKPGIDVVPEPYASIYFPVR